MTDQRATAPKQTFEEWSIALRAEFAKYGSWWARVGRDLVVDQECWRDMYDEGLSAAEACREEISAEGA